MLVYQRLLLPLPQPLPMMHMEPRRNHVTNPSDYRSPLYKTLARAGVLSTTGIYSHSVHGPGLIVIVRCLRVNSYLLGCLRVNGYCYPIIQVTRLTLLLLLSCPPACLRTTGSTREQHSSASSKNKQQTALITQATCNNYCN